MNQTEFGMLGGVTKDSQLNYEKGTRRPDSSYLEALAAQGVDVTYLLTGMRTPTGTLEAATQPAVNGVRSPAMRSLTPDQVSLLENYENANETGRAAARTVLDALAQQNQKLKSRQLQEPSAP
ncbi:MAG: helix-turn-helix transcriptional regulator [Comamonas sp.]